MCVFLGVLFALKGDYRFVGFVWSMVVCGFSSGFLGFVVVMCFSGFFHGFIIHSKDFGGFLWIFRTLFL